MTELEKYYNKFNEEKRLLRRHGNIEFITSMRYIHKYLEEMTEAKILDIGAGTGRYSVALAEEGYDVTAVELVKYNLGILKKKNIFSGGEAIVEPWEHNLNKVRCTNL